MAAFKKRAGLYWRISELLNDRISHRPLSPVSKSFLLLASSLVVIPLASLQATATASAIGPSTEKLINQLLNARVIPIHGEVVRPQPDQLAALPELDQSPTQPVIEAPEPAQQSNPEPVKAQQLATAETPTDIPPDPVPFFSLEEAEVEFEPVDIERYQVVKQSKPRYPRRALERGIEGSVTVEFTITASGNVSNATIVRASPEGVFDKAVLRALKKYHFEPQRIDGTAVETPEIRNQFTFRLDDPPRKRRRSSDP